MDFHYYPNITDDKFEEQLLKKKEFRNIYPSDINKTIFQQLQPQQEFLRQYISVDTPYNGVLIFHGTGVGKTCTAINIAEGFREYSLKKHRKILILSSSVVKHQFVDEIYNFNKPPNKQCIGDRYISGIDMSNKKYEEKKKILYKMVNKIYEFYGYLEFANKVAKKLKSTSLSKIDTDKSIQKKIYKLYSNRVIIIDEIHNLRKSNIATETKKASIIIEAIVKYAVNIKLILMSATPMYDNATEIIYILNLLLLNDKKELIKQSDIFNKLELKPGAMELLLSKSKGYISYYRSERPYIFPFRIIPPETKILQYKYDIKGGVINTADSLKYTYLFPCPVSKEHYTFYNKQFNTNIKNNTIVNSNASSGSILTDEKKEALFLNISNKYNIIYPTNKINNFVIGKDGFQKKKNNIGGFYETKLNKNIIYKYQSHAINKANVPFLDNTRIQLYSAKFHALLNNVMNSTGKVFIFVSEIKTGIIPISLLLEQNGFIRYTYKGNLPLLDSKYKQRPCCYQCGQQSDAPNHNPSNPEYHSFKTAKYIGISSQNSDIINKTRILFNSKQNMNGEELKILIGTRVLSEGIDFKGIRQLHIVEPWYNISRLEQVIGRGIRTHSHEGLEQIKHNVEIFMYVNTPSTDSSNKNKQTEMIDINMYRTAERKDIQIKKVEHILKNNAIDCGLFEYTNIIHDTKIENQVTSRGRHIKYNIKDMPYTRMCDYMKECKMTCKFSISNSNIINTDTYDIKDNTSRIKTIKYKIKELINTSYIFTLDTLFQFLDNSVIHIFVYKALNDIIQKKESVVYNKIKGTLMYYNRFYIFQPLNIQNKQVPLHYRNSILYNKAHSTAIDITNININKSDKSNTLKVDVTNILKNYDSMMSIIIPHLKVKQTTKLNFIILEMILDRLPITTMFNLVNMYKVDNTGNNILIDYFKQIYKSTKTRTVINKYKYIKNKETIDVSIKKYNDPLPKKLPVEYGIFDNKMNKFKIVDSLLDTNIKTKHNEISKKSKSSGRVCTTFDKKYIMDIYNRVCNKTTILQPVSKSSKTHSCSLLEFLFRYIKEHSNTTIYLTYI